MLQPERAGLYAGPREPSWERQISIKLLWVWCCYIVVDILEVVLVAGQLDCRLRMSELSQHNVVGQSIAIAFVLFFMIVLIAKAVHTVLLIRKSSASHNVDVGVNLDSFLAATMRIGAAFTFGWMVIVMRKGFWAEEVLLGFNSLCLALTLFVHQMLVLHLRTYRPRRSRAAAGNSVSTSVKVLPPGTRIVLKHDTDETCYICLDNLEQGQAVYKLPCRHSFHSECLENWFNVHRSCPVRCDLTQPTEAVPEEDQPEMLAVPTRPVLLAVPAFPSVVPGQEHPELVEDIRWQVLV